MSEFVDKNLSSVDKSPELQFATFSRRIMSWIPVFLVSLGIIILLGIAVSKYINNTRNDSNNVLGSDSESSGSGKIKTKMLLVDISGAVVMPGVYELPDDSRIQDVLISARGLDPNADRNYVAKSINLAQKVTDGQKIYIPFKSNGINTDSQQISTNPVTTGIINLNSASASQLDTLVGVGPVTAQKIISARPYSDINELVSRKVVSKSEFEKIKDKISI